MPDLAGLPFDFLPDFALMKRIREVAATVPGVDGIALLKWVKANRTTPVILITARSDANLEAKAAIAGAVCLLRKPFEINDLIGCIEGAVKD